MRSFLSRVLAETPRDRKLFLFLCGLGASLAVAGVLSPLVELDNDSPSYFSDVSSGYGYIDNWPVTHGKFVVVPAFATAFLFALSLWSDRDVCRLAVAVNGILLLAAFFAVNTTGRLDSWDTSTGVPEVNAGVVALIPVAAALTIAAPVPWLRESW